jgi:hypothetical protein
VRPSAAKLTPRRRTVGEAERREVHRREAEPADPRPGALGRSPRRSPGLREALLVGELVVVVVLLAGVATYLLPSEARDLILRGPVLILVLLGGTAAVLWRISRPGRVDR